MIHKRYNIYNFDDNHIITPNTIVLCNRNQDKIGSIPKYYNFHPSFDMSSYNEVSFTVNKYSDMEICHLWEDITDLKLIYIPEYDEYYEISVSLNESDTTIKSIVGQSLCEAELSQLYLNNIEINTEEDILREDYKVPTIIYKPEEPENSLLHRILRDKAPHYVIEHVDISIAKKQRSFSINGDSIYDFLTNKLAEELECLVVFNSSTRGISLYDLNPFCNKCGERIDLEKDEACPNEKCKSTDFNEGYGENTTIFISKDNLSKDVTLSVDKDSVKNRFRISGGDDIITASVAACNPSGNNYITYFSADQKKNMSDKLIAKLDEYEKIYEENTEPYQKIMQEVYDTIDEISYLTSEKMPDIEVNKETTAEKEVAKLTRVNIGTVAVTDINVASAITVNSSVLSIAKILIAKGYTVTVDNNSYTYDKTSRKWSGKFTVTRNTDKEDKATSKNNIVIDINDDYINFVEQKIQKALMASKENYSILNPDLTLDQLKVEVKRYCLNRLKSFESAYQSCVDILIQLGISEQKNSLYSTFYKTWLDKLTVIQSEIKIISTEIDGLNKKLEDLELKRDAIQDKLELQNFFTDDLWKEYCSHIREDEYSNDNYISDGLTNAEIFEKARELIQVASDELYKASTYQHSVTSTISNLLTLDEFKSLWKHFQLGVWIFLEIDESLYKLRLTHIEPNFDELNDLDIEFSDVKKTRTGTDDVKSIISKAHSLSTSYNYVARQAKQGSKASSEIEDLKENGLSTASFKIFESENKEVVFDEHGILCRIWDEIEGAYSPCQIRIIGDMIVFTDDNWKTTKTALGKITIDGITKYGLMTDIVHAGDIIGCNIIGSEITGTKFNNGNGTFMLDENGRLTVSEIIITGGEIKLGNFNVDNEGIVKFDDVIMSGEFSGKISVKNGDIGYFKIASTSLYNGLNVFNDENSTYFGEDGLSIKDKFSVNSLGEVDIKTGNIGNWKVTETKISDGTLESSNDSSILSIKDGIIQDNLINRDLSYQLGYNEDLKSGILVFPDSGTSVNLESFKNTYIGKLGIHSDKDISTEKSFISILNNSLFYQTKTTLPIIEEFGHETITEDGYVDVNIPKEFLEVADTTEYYINLTSYAEDNLFVMKKTETNFRVSGLEGTEFDWCIKAVQKDIDATKYRIVEKMSDIYELSKG